MGRMRIPALADLAVTGLLFRFSVSDLIEHRHAVGLERLRRLGKLIESRDSHCT
ncbi:hypothetical protein AB7M56_002853 [Bradyrhizobium elkanii]|nr:hypothetical protein [Bradyrhizobium elkanii]MCS4003832.1 hypothetical protein [Bradyrhizobium elkanii USDA 61]MCP1932911.1 hypothetical protein [Bradyrhizobium elkanii]MCP1968858.1 hypothetical protein [Bradyrhizobium elkanii]MCS3479077.1 hypothetical protein [Bradyrhizobium elkanii]